MRKTLLTIGLILLSVAFIYGTAGAVVSGPCSDCHTMHNSQDGSPMAKAFDGTAESTAQAYLTVSTCLGCHNGMATGAPNIFGTTTQTAGGSFAVSVFDDDNKGHNVTDASSVLATGLETDNTTATPGNSGTGDSTLTVGLQELTCAGALGCHGDHSVSTSSMDAIRGFHHGAKEGYRYLQTSTGTAILGKGEADWENGGASDTKHNVYSADSTAGISVLCAQCHGDFHGASDTVSGSNFIRHPTENLLSDATTWTMGSVNVDYDDNPFAFSGTPYDDASTTVAYTTTGAQVACVSCHRAHGTAYDDILRFDYDGQVAGSGTSSSTGCLGCHHLQR